MTSGRCTTAWVAAAWLAVAAVGTLGGLLAGAPGRSAAAAVPFVLAAAVVVVVARTGAGERGGRTWLLALGVGGTLLAVLTLGTFLGALSAGIGEPSGFYRVKVLVTTPVGDHNTVGGLLVVGVVATVLLAVEERRWWGGVAATTVGTVATLSRGAAVVLLAVGLGAALVRTRRVVVIGVLVAGTVATGGVSLAATLLDAAPPPGAAVPDGPLGTSLVARADLAVRGAEVAAAHPLAGVGLGGFADEAGDLPPPNDHAHNAVAHLGAEAGVVGVVVALGLPALLAWQGLRLAPGWRRELVLLGGAGLVAHAQVDVLAGLAGYEVVLAVLVGLAVAAWSEATPVGTGPRWAGTDVR